MLNIASLGMRFNLHNVKCRFARYAFKKMRSVPASPSAPHGEVKNGSISRCSVPPP